MGDDLVGIGKIAEALEKATKECRELMLRLLGPAADAAGERLADCINAARSKNFDRVVQEVLQQLEAIQTEPAPVELKILVPVLQYASLDNDDELVSKWAGLLASAAAGEQVHPSYPRILAELTPGEARLLNLTDEWNENISAVASEKKDKLPGHSYPKDELLKRTGLNGHLLLERTGLTMDVLPVTMFALETRHGLVHFYGQKWGPNLEELWQMTLTPLGKDFVRVCRGPRAKVND
jgi:hypothetical protein